MSQFWVALSMDKEDARKTPTSLHQASSELLELSTRDEHGHKISDIVFAAIQDRSGNTILSGRDQNIFNPDFKMKRFMTLNQIFF